MNASEEVLTGPALPKKALADALRKRGPEPAEEERPFSLKEASRALRPSPSGPAVLAHFDETESVVPAPNGEGPEPAEAIQRPATGTGQQSRALRFTKASAIRPVLVEWLWADRVPLGEVTITAGKGGNGKSTFHAGKVAEVTRGTLEGALLGKPRACVIAATEDSWDRTIVPRLMAAGADLELVYRVEVVTDAGFAVSVSLPADLDGLERFIGANEVALLCVDPLLGVLHGSLDTYKDRDVRQALEPLARLADRTGCAVLGNAHFNKGAGTDPVALIMASAAFANVSRAALAFVRDEAAGNGACVLSQIKNNLGRLDLPSLSYRIEEALVDTPEGVASVGRFVLLGESHRSVADILGASGRVDRDDDGDDAAAVLTELLAAGPMWAKQVYEEMAEAGFSSNQVKRAKKKVGATAIKVGGRGDAEAGWKWALPGADR